MTEIKCWKLTNTHIGESKYWYSFNEMIEEIQKFHEFDMPTKIREKIKNFYIGQSIESPFLEFEISRVYNLIEWTVEEVDNSETEATDFACLIMKDHLLEDVRDYLGDRDIVSCCVRRSDDITKADIYIGYGQPSYQARKTWLKVVRL